jgi:protoheme IX farnesyltransferase
MSTMLCDVAADDSVALAPARSVGWQRVADFVELTKPKIAVMELVTVTVAAFVARWHALDLVTLLHTLIGTTLVAGSASALNQCLEIPLDRMMDRTVDRPLPAGRIAASEAIAFGLFSVVMGVAYLALMVGTQVAALGLLSWVLYVLIYTPLKTRTTLNTFIGAVAGAMPVLMGWFAAGGAWGLAPLVLFAIVFLWQFPHFMAIAWLYRKQYAASGMKMLSVVDATGRSAGVQAVCSALVLLPVSLLPAVIHCAGIWYFAAALMLGLGQLATAVWFCRARHEKSARYLLRASLIYLPLLLGALVLGPFI